MTTQAMNNQNDINKLLLKQQTQHKYMKTVPDDYGYQESGNDNDDNYNADDFEEEGQEEYLYEEDDEQQHQQEVQDQSILILFFKQQIEKQHEEQYVVDLTKFKGIYYNDDNKKFQDEETGAHFEYSDLCRRLDRLLILRIKWEEKERLLLEKQQQLLLEQELQKMQNQQLQQQQQQQSQQNKQRTIQSYSHQQQQQLQQLQQQQQQQQNDCSYLQDNSQFGAPSENFNDETIEERRPYNAIQNIQNQNNRMAQHNEQTIINAKQQNRINTFKYSQNQPLQSQERQIGQSNNNQNIDLLDPTKKNLMFKNKFLEKEHHLGLSYLNQFKGQQSIDQVNNLQLKGKNQQQTKGQMIQSKSAREIFLESQHNQQSQLQNQQIMDITGTTQTINNRYTMNKGKSSLGLTGQIGDSSGMSQTQRQLVVNAVKTNPALTQFIEKKSNSSMLQTQQNFLNSSNSRKYIAVDSLIKSSSKKLLIEPKPSNSQLIGLVMAKNKQDRKKSSKNLALLQAEIRNSTASIQPMMTKSFVIVGKSPQLNNNNGTTMALNTSRPSQGQQRQQLQGHQYDKKLKTFSGQKEAQKFKDLINDVNRQFKHTKLSSKQSIIDSNVKQLAQSMLGGKEQHKVVGKSRNMNIMNNSGGGNTGKIGGKSSGTYGGTTASQGGENTNQILENILTSPKIPHNTLNNLGGAGSQIKSRNANHKNSIASGVSMPNVDSQHQNRRQKLVKTSLGHSNKEKVQLTDREKQPFGEAQVKPLQGRSLISSLQTNGSELKVRKSTNGQYLYMDSHNNNNEKSKSELLRKSLGKSNEKRSFISKPHQ